MADRAEKMNVDLVVELLNKALRLQYRSALQYALAGGGMTGLPGQALSGSFAEWSREELDDGRLLIEKITALGGAPATDVAALPDMRTPADAIEALVENETEAIAALHDVIPETGQEPRSEALEHLLEHLIMRKQNQLDLLLRVSRAT
jgi:bacterioferritin (cytochrome b1)